MVLVYGQLLDFIQQFIFLRILLLVEGWLVCLIVDQVDNFCLLGVVVYSLIYRDLFFVFFLGVILGEKYYFKNYYEYYICGRFQREYYKKYYEIFAVYKVVRFQ